RSDQDFARDQGRGRAETHQRTDHRAGSATTRCVASEKWIGTVKREEERGRRGEVVPFASSAFRPIATGFLVLDPNRSILEILLLPDRSDLLQTIYPILTGLESDLSMR